MNMHMVSIGLVVTAPRFGLVLLAWSLVLCQPHPATHPATHIANLDVFSPPDETSCVDLFSWCHLVPQHGVCNHKFYGQQCCKSCTGNKP